MAHSLNTDPFVIQEATIKDIQRAFSENQLTSRQLVDFYIQQIDVLNPKLNGVLEVNPDSGEEADKADSRIRNPLKIGELEGIPVLLKDIINTKDKLSTTARSYALLGAEVSGDATVVERLRKAGAVILGKASMSEWSQFRSLKLPLGWCARGGQGMNPYVEFGDSHGSSSGSAISVTANMVAVSLGAETNGSIICPADYNSVVGFKPTVGLTSRAGIITISLRQDTVGPICKTVSDAVYVLDVIYGFDPRDSQATLEASNFIADGGYKQFLNENGLAKKRLGVVRIPFSGSYTPESIARSDFENHLNTLKECRREKGAIIVDNLEIDNIDDTVLNPGESGESKALAAEFKLNINEYMRQLITSPVRSLADIIPFNNNSLREKTEEYGQDMLMLSEMTNGIGEEERAAMEMMANLSRDGFEKLMKENELDATMSLGPGMSGVLAIGGYPGVTVPAGYEEDGMPFGICFGGLKGSEPKLIEVAYGFEQATKIRRPPPAI